MPTLIEAIAAVGLGTCLALVFNYLDSYNISYGLRRLVLGALIYTPAMVAIRLITDTTISFGGAVVIAGVFLLAFGILNSKDDIRL